jgi:hypothetical protein
VAGAAWLASAPAARAAGDQVRFASPVNYPLPGQAGLTVPGASPIAVGDLDGKDGPDLAIVNTGGGTVSILLNNGDGGFTASAPVTVGDAPAGVAVGDFDGKDGPDLAVTNEGDGTVSILLNNGDGTFTPSAPVTVGSEPAGVTVGDFDGKHGPDLAVTNFADNSVSILLNDGDGTFTKTATDTVLPQGQGPVSLVARDFDGDGTDLAVTVVGNSAGAPTSAVYLLHGNDDGTFAAPEKVTGGPSGAFAYALGAGDLNADGHPDLAVGEVTLAAGGGFPTGGDVQVLLGDGQGHFTPDSDTSLGSNAPLALTLADLDGDGALDVATFAPFTTTATVLLQRSPGPTSLAPNRQDFGTQAQGTIGAARTFTLTPSQGALQVGRVRVTGDDANDFIVTADGCAGQTVKPGDSCAVHVRFAPGAHGARSATLEISDDAPNTPQTATLTGTGGALPQGVPGPQGPAGPAGPAGVVPGLPPSSPAKLLTRRTRLRHRRVIRLHLRCPATVAFCTGQIKLITRGRLGGRRRALANKAFKTPGGSPRLTRIRLTRHPAKLIRRYARHHRRLRLIAYLVTRTPQNQATTSKQRLNLKLRRHHKRRHHKHGHHKH